MCLNIKNFKDNNYFLTNRLFLPIEFTIKNYSLKKKKEKKNPSTYENKFYTFAVWKMKIHDESQTILNNLHCTFKRLTQVAFLSKTL